MWTIYFYRRDTAPTSAALLGVRWGKRRSAARGNAAARGKGTSRFSTMPHLKALQEANQAIPSMPKMLCHGNNSGRIVKLFAASSRRVILVSGWPPNPIFDASHKLETARPCSSTFLNHRPRKEAARQILRPRTHPEFSACVQPLEKKWPDLIMQYSSYFSHFGPR